MSRCNWCGKKLSDIEKGFKHCLKCNAKRLDKLTPDFEPCPTCRQNGAKKQ